MRIRNCLTQFASKRSRQSECVAGGRYGALKRVLAASRLVVSVAIISVVTPTRDASACGGTLTLVPPAVVCTKTLVMSKASPFTFIVPPAGPLTITIPVTVFCRSGPAPGAVCPAPATPVSATATLSMAGPLPALPLVATGAVSTAAGTMPLPGCNATPGGLSTGPFPVTMTVIPPILAGAYLVFGSVSVTFSDGMTLTAFGDMVVCLVEESPDIPGQPRLDIALLTPDVQFVAPGDQAGIGYLVTNNDLTNSVNLTLLATSKQVAFTPQVDPPPPVGQIPEDMGVYAVANANGDDFVIEFVDQDPGECIALPPHPHNQVPITQPLVLAPGQSQIVTVGMRPWGQCGGGSCSETTLQAFGTYSNGDPAVGCAGSALWVDTNLPTENWGFEVNDCNGDGEYDAVEIITGQSADDNANGVPDECECPWDCGDQDGNVGIVDFLALLAQWGGPGFCDFDGGGVGIVDFLKLLANWGPCP